MRSPGAHELRVPVRLLGILRHEFGMDVVIPGRRGQRSLALDRSGASSANACGQKGAQWASG